MSDCHSWPLDVSNNLSGYFISNSVLVTSCVSMGGSSAFGSHWQHWTVKSPLCPLAVQLGGPSAFGIYMYIYAMVFPYIFLLVDCFEWAVIGHIEQQRVHSVLWQFQMEGVYHKFYLGKTDFSLYFFLISWLFQMGCHWWHWKAVSSLRALAVSNWVVCHQFYLGKSENVSSPAVLCFASQKVFSYYIWKT